MKEENLLLKKFNQKKSSRKNKESPEEVTTPNQKRSPDIGHVQAAYTMHLQIGILIKAIHVHFQESNGL